MDVKFSPKQWEVLKKPLSILNALEGVTGSGKSYAWNIRFYKEILKLPPNVKALATGSTLESLYKNVISELEMIDAGIGDLTFLRSGGGVNRIITKHGVEVFCVGINKPCSSLNDSLFLVYQLVDSLHL